MEPDQLRETREYYDETDLSEHIDISAGKIMRQRSSPWSPTPYGYRSR